MLERGAYLVTLDRIDATTDDAILNCASRSLIPWRWAIQAKSVYAVQTSPLSFSNTSSRTGQSSPAFGFDVMNCAPSGGLPNVRSIDGRNVTPVPAASFDWSTSPKNMMPLPLTSCLMRATVSVIGWALLTLMMPSAPASVRAENDKTPTIKPIRAAGTRMMRRNMGGSLEMRARMRALRAQG